MKTYRNILLHLIWLYDDINDNKNLDDETKQLCIANIDTILCAISNGITLDYIDKCIDQDDDCSDTCDICPKYECVGCKNNKDLPFA